MDGSARHRPVLLNEVAELLAPVGPIIIDCTLGLGGHAGALLKISDRDVQLVGMDADESNLTRAKVNLAPFGSRVRFFHANFSQIDEVLEAADIQQADTILADLGFCSNQVDDAARGLSFSADGPLDMRLDQSQGQTAADLVNTLAEEPLANLIYEYGEERCSRRIARRIVEARKQRQILRTAELAEIVKRAMPPPKSKGPRRIHPATRTFQALRIAVNDEMQNLDLLLEKLPRALRPGGKAAVISFHSLEDRRVKQAFAQVSAAARANLLTKKPITASEAEMDLNPRSRSAKLRGMEII